LEKLARERDTYNTMMTIKREEDEKNKLKHAEWVRNNMH
jgi:hypothetical protein